MPGQPKRSPLPTWPLMLTTAALATGIGLVLVYTIGTGGPTPDAEQSGPHAPPATTVRKQDAQTPIAVSERQEEGVLFVTEPAGANVILDGRFVGVSPVEVQGVEDGRHVLRLERKDYRPAQREIEIGTAAIVKSDLQPRHMGAVLVESTPAGADVFLDGTRRGLTPLRIDDLPPADYEILLRKPNFDEYATTARIEPGETPQVVQAELTDRVERYYLQAIEENPRDLPLYTDLAHWYFINGRMDDSLEYFDQGLVLADDSSIPYEESKQHHKEIRKHLSWVGQDLDQEDFIRFRRHMSELLREHRQRRPEMPPEVRRRIIERNQREQAPADDEDEEDD
jgi:hypothetical protein